MCGTERAPLDDNRQQLLDTRGHIAIGNPAVVDSGPWRSSIDTGLFGIACSCTVQAPQCGPLDVPDREITGLGASTAKPS